MTNGFSGVESALRLSPSKAKRNSYGFRFLTPVCGNGDVLSILKTHSSWVYH
jgi:hypothetical protein